MCCLSFNFFQPTLECQLNYRTKEQSPNDFFQKKGSFYRNKDTIPASLAGVCGTNGASLDGRGVARTCVPRDRDVTTPSTNRSKGPSPNVTHNCDDVMGSHTCNGVYTLTGLEVYNVFVFCDMRTFDGGWLVFQRRMDGSEDFYRTWNEYRDGFGDVDREFWLGNDIIHKITSRAVYELRVDLEDFEGNTRYAMYSTFSLASEAENYTLHIGLYSGDAGNMLGWHNNLSFSTKDLDSDFSLYSCAVSCHGAWWYNRCHACNLNGWYLGGPTHTYAKGVTWYGWRGHYYSLKRTEMKIRPILS